MMYRGHRHQWVARVLGALTALVMVVPVLLLRSLPNVAVICLAVLALFAYERLGHRFDQVDPWASGGVALLRLALPPPVIVFGVLLSASALAEPGDALGQFTAMAIAFGVLPMIVVLCPLFDIRVSVDTLRAQKLGTPPPPSHNRRLPIVYRSLSSLLMAVAVPPGIAIFYLVNYCRPSTTASTVFGETILFVLIVIAGNGIAGWMMDRVWGSSANFGTCLAGSVGAAIVVTLFGIVVLQVVGLLTPTSNGESMSCG